MTLTQWIMVGFTLGFFAGRNAKDAMQWCLAVFVAELTVHLPPAYQQRFGCNLWYGAYCATLVAYFVATRLWAKHTAPQKLHA